MKTTVDLDDELHAQVQNAAGLIGEKPATILRLAIREGLPVLAQKFQRHPPEGYFADAYGDSERIEFEKAMGTATMMDFAKKILTASNLAGWRDQLRRAGRKLVVTNGCFDVLHLGHVTYLQQARQQGDALLVGVTSDDGVRQLKGPGRPLNSEQDRAAVLAALESVNGVCVFHELDARAFLQTVRPDIYVKGGDYTLETINQDERRLLEELGIRIVILAGVPGKSTSALIQKMQG